MQSISPMFHGLRGSSARLLVSMAAAAFVYTLASPAHANAPQGTFVTFNIPGCPRDIFVSGINPAGAIAGTCRVPAIDVFLGFLRAPSGAVTIVNVPGSTSTFIGAGGMAEPFAGPPINAAGAIVGSFTDTGGITHGFVRASDGTFTRFDAPGAVNTDLVCCITPAGTVAGISFDASESVGHGFLRAPNGTFTVFDPPGSTITAPTGLNPAGVMSGVYFDANFVEHGFLRALDGTITTFDVAGAVNGTEPDGINPAGVITGRYVDASFNTHGFLRAPDGTFTTFDAPGSMAPFGTTAVGINPAGAISGGYFDGFTFHGFVRAPDGTFTTVDPPGFASTSAGPINPAGVIVGSYSDANFVEHAFVFFPR